MKKYIYGFPPSVEDSAFLDINEVDYETGRNTGNLAFCYAVWKQLGGLPTVRWLDQNHSFVLADNIGILTLANQLGRHADMGYFVEILKKHESKLVGIGLGAQANFGEVVELPLGTQEWVRLIQERSPSDNPNIGVRGEHTLSVLERYGLSEKAVVVGCPTLFMNQELKLGKRIALNWNKSPRRIAVTAGHPGWSGLWKLETSLAELLTSAHDYIVQSPTSMISLGRGIDHKQCDLDLENIRRYVRPDLSIDKFDEWRLNHAICFLSAPAWMEHLRRFDFVVGLRIHGVMLALQMGIPALCIVHDRRTEELCQTMMVPHVHVSLVRNGINKEKLIDLFKFDADAFDENRLILGKRYCNFLQSNKLEMVPYMRRFLSSF